MTKQELRPGVHTQLYRGASGYKVNKSAWLDACLEHGTVGIIEHGFVGDLTPKKYAAYKEEHVKHGLQSAASFGFGDLKNTDNAKVMARSVAAVARLTDYCVIDGEGLWDDEVVDTEKVSAFYQELREKAPDTLIVDQPPSRPIERRHPHPIWILAAKWTDKRAPMLYLNNLRGTGEGRLGDDAYERIMPDYKNDWNTIVPRRSEKMGVDEDPWIPTFQAYHWVLETLVDALLDNPVVFMWCENHNRVQGRCVDSDDWSTGPYPTPRTRLAMRVVTKLRALGFTGLDAVQKFRASKCMSPAPMRVRADKKTSTIPMIDAPFLVALGVRLP